jgi:O-acetylserine/cysteine efflux transporter
MKQATLPASHLLLALAVVAVWGTNFVVIKLALAHVPPLLFAALRFLFAFLPAAFFVKRPTVPLRILALYGLFIGPGQFALLYIAMEHWISPGLASLVIQMQAFFTIGLSIWLADDHIHAYQGVALGFAGAGLAVIFSHASGDATSLGIALVLVAALSWAAGNVVAKRRPAENMLAYVVWASLFSFPPLIALSLMFEGPKAIASSLAGAGALTWAAVLYQSVGNTLFGYASWSFLLARHPAATVSPLALLVPIVGMGTSAFLLGEGLPLWKLLAAALVMAGLALNVLWPLLHRVARRAPAT